MTDDNSSSKQADTVSIELSQEVADLLATHLQTTLLDAANGHIRCSDEPEMYAALTASLRAVPASNMDEGDVGSIDAYTDYEHAFDHETGTIDYEQIEL